MVPKLLADISPLREYPAYRRLWAGETISSLGSQITATAVLLQVFAIPARRSRSAWWHWCRWSAAGCSAAPSWTRWIAVASR
ncbi:hypothetical protein [Candidatus Frankia alpina]|uniref:hypothetical protein n=1 Tax=Candidatus Frankia alpina TaxID=2699483 RepID=UPI001F491E52|nr:hypothetical protein [Candidatus Frankia alpina]